VKVAQQEGGQIITVLQKQPDEEAPQRNDLCDVGTICGIKRVLKKEGGAQIVLEGQTRVVLGKKSPHRKYLRIEYEPMVDLGEMVAEGMSPEAEAIHRENRTLAEKIANLLDEDKEQVLRQLLGKITNPVTRAYHFLSNGTGYEISDAQKALELNSAEEVLKAAFDTLSKEVTVLKVQREIQKSTRENTESMQREAMLRQQKKAIEEALGDDAGDDDELIELRRMLREINFPDETKKELDRELKRIQRMAPHHAEFQVARSYLELVTELPWNTVTEDSLDLKHAKKILDEDHYGLDDVKDRILEALAVLSLNPEAKASILCFVGPPGVGKTSLGQSIARAMGRKFQRMSLGGLHDEGELRGHRRTYIGAMPGRIIQAIRRSGVRNPVLMLDEIDKLGRDFRGDPSSALMEILDPAQNKEFRDNYLNLPFDLSKVFFIATANTLDGIPRPLLDRMERLELSGYTELEKVQIARTYLIPRQIENNGLKPEQLKLTEDGLNHTIRKYTREAGVRELERTIERIARKRAKDSLMQGKLTEFIDADEIVGLLGPEKFKEENLRLDLTSGVATGLAWTEAGGDVLYVEASLTQKDEKVTITGHIGQVMQESAKAARSYIWSAADEFKLSRTDIESTGVHIHVPAGAVPKDGPSAGVTMATALVSAYANKKVRSDVAMTGELTLSGLVLPVGGIREKILAAHRNGIRHIIMPKENESELIKLPDVVKTDLKISLVDKLSDVVKIAIPELNKTTRRKRQTKAKPTEN
ncbi:MAG: endopeptidase La, partial [Gammaproteobacteria bacterium]|nr:endopeptidase La [Gammaproteobacteria bacterium]